MGNNLMREICTHRVKQPIVTRINNFPNKLDSTLDKNNNSLCKLSNRDKSIQKHFVEKRSKIFQ